MLPLFPPEVLAEFPMFVGATLFLLAVVGIGEALNRFLAFPSEHSRRLIHAATGCFVAFTPYLFKHPHWIYVLASTFVIANIIAIRKTWFKGMHGIERHSWGTATFPLALLFALFFGWTSGISHQFSLQTAFLILAFADPLASLIGMRLKNPSKYTINGHTKSIEGSLTFAGVALVICLIVLPLTTSWSWEIIPIAAVFTATVAALVEALGGDGWDNFFIVVASMTVLVFIEQHPTLPQIMNLTFALVAGLIFASASYRAGFLALSGALAVVLLASSVLGLVDHWGWALTGMTFFILSSLLSLWGKSRKSRIESRNDKSSRRDSGQVYANGGVSWAFLVAYVFIPHESLFWGFVGAFAAAAADTWATEIGGYFQGSTRLITNLKQVEAGTSGAISWQGTLGGCLGAISVWAAGLVYYHTSLIESLVLIVGSAFFAMLFDSILGATIQAMYETPSGQITERTDANGQTFKLVQGWRWMNNDRVNFFCTLVGGLLPYLYFQFTK